MGEKTLCFDVPVAFDYLRDDDSLAKLMHSKYLKDNDITETETSRMKYRYSLYTKDHGDYIEGRSAITAVGVFDYGKNKKILRAHTEVDDYDSLITLKNSVLTNDHPKSLVDAENYKKYQVGAVSIWDIYVYPPGVVIADWVARDKTAIDAIRGGKVGFSCGYLADIVEEKGNYNGSTYDYVQKDIRYNHVALVDVGRAGDLCRMIDFAPNGSGGGNPSTSLDTLDASGKREENTMSKLTLDNGVIAEADDSVISYMQILKEKNAKLTTDLGAETTKLVDSKKSEDLKQAAIDAAKVEVETLTKKVADLEAKDNSKEIEDSVNLYLQAINKGFEIKDKQGKILPIADLKNSVIKNYLGDSVDLKEKTADYLTAMFDIALQKASNQKPNMASQRSTQQDSQIPQTPPNGEDAYAGLSQQDKYFRKMNDQMYKGA